MPQYEFLCDSCGYYEELKGTFDTPREMTCPACQMEKAFRKQISNVSFIIKGSSARNGYASVPTNEQIGLPPERELMKRLDSEYWMENVQSGREVNEVEKDIIKEHKRQEAEAKKPVQDKVKLFKEKYPDLAKKADAAFKRAKSKSGEEKSQRRARKKREGDLGTRHATQQEKNEANARIIGRK